MLRIKPPRYQNHFRWQVVDEKGVEEKVLFEAHTIQDATMHLESLSPQAKAAPARPASVLQPAAQVEEKTKAKRGGNAAFDF